MPTEIWPRRGISRRVAIEEAVKSNPGIHLRGLQSLLGMATGALQHHLSTLLKKGELKYCKSGRYTRFFPYDYTENEMRFLSLLCLPTSKRLLVHMLQRTGCSIPELAISIGVSNSTVAWHLSRFMECGILDVMGAGRNRRYAICCTTDMLRSVLEHKETLPERLVDRLMDMLDIR